MLITILGFGHVGANICQLLLSYTGCNLRINIMDPDEKLLGRYCDMKQASVLSGHKLHWNDAKMFGMSDFIFHAAGARVPKTGDRRYVSDKSKEITASIFSNVSFTNDPFIIVIANPVDMISHYTLKYSQLDRQKVLGVGTLLDTIRFKSYLSSISGYASEVIKTMVVGEHGSGMKYLSNYCNVDGVNYNDIKNEVDFDAAFESTINASKEIKEHEAATIYGISMCSYKIFNWISSGDDIVVPLSVSLSDANSSLLKFHGAVSVPVNLGKSGAIQLNNVAYTSNELKELQSSLAEIQHLFE